jgi:hypothetical protein
MFDAKCYHSSALMRLYTWFVRRLVLLSSLSYSVSFFFTQELLANNFVLIRSTLIIRVIQSHTNLLKTPEGRELVLLRRRSEEKYKNESLKK